MGFYSTKCIEVIYLIRQYIKMLKVPIVVEEDIEIKSLDYVKEKLKYIRKTIHWHIDLPPFFVPPLKLEFVFKQTVEA